MLALVSLLAAHCPQYRKELRTVSLASHAHSTPYNPLTGEPLREVRAGDRPSVPAERASPATAQRRR
jgi:hypothetical protein